MKVIHKSHIKENRRMNFEQGAERDVSEMELYNKGIISIKN